MTDINLLIEGLRKAAYIEKKEWGALHEFETETMFDNAADALTDLEARIRIETKRAEDAEARNDFLIAELDKLIEKAKS